MSPSSSVDQHSTKRLSRRMTSPPMYNEPPQSLSILCGLISGICQAGLFNPYDRALYLSVKHNRPFLSRINFQNGYSGFGQSVFGRAMASGAYFPLEHFCLSLAIPDDGKSHPLYVFLAGTSAGAMNAIILNPLSAVKYKTWGRVINRGMWVEASEMFHKGGLRPFFNGLKPTLFRDIAFGGCYTYLRYAINGPLPDHHQWLGNMISAGIATMVSGPFNLARNEQYATRSKKVAPTIPQVFSALLQQVAEQDTLSGKLIFLQNRLRIGWGTARVAVGMAFGHYVYDKCMDIAETRRF